MIVAVLKINGKPYVQITTDYSYCYYVKPLIDEMWMFDTLGM